MNRTSHLIMGGMFAAVAIVVGKLSLVNIPLAAMAFFGSIFPDYDLAYGTHRKTLHNIWAMGLVGGYFWYYGFSWLGSAFFMIGFLSHLAADALTVRGITPLYPIINWHIRGPIKTGHTSETVAMVILIIIFSILIIALLMRGELALWLKSILS